jgi:hypothetical protein
MESLLGPVPDFRDLIADPPEPWIVWYGTISKPPTNFAEKVSVILPDWDDTLEWGPCMWQPRDAVTLPKIGDQCLVLLDNNRQPWVVAWWPFS